MFLLHSWKLPWAEAMTLVAAIVIERGPVCVIAILCNVQSRSGCKVGRHSDSICDRAPLCSISWYHFKPIFNMRAPTLPRREYLMCMVHRHSSIDRYFDHNFADSFMFIFRVWVRCSLISIFVDQLLLLYLAIPRISLMCMVCHHPVFIIYPYVSKQR